MVTEDYVSFETALLLKEKGFDGECDLFGRTDESGRIIHEASKIAYSQGIDDECVILPTLQMAMKWLREVHNLFIQTEITSWPRKGFFVKIYLYKKQYNDFEEVSYVKYEKSYEQACEASIKYCLENLNNSC